MTKLSIQISTEPNVKEALSKLANAQGCSSSSLGRKIIIEYLIDKGVLTPNMVLGVR